MKRMLLTLTLSLLFLCGCSSLLERTYSTAEPHSSKLWESEAAGTLRAENYQDIVNDLLLLIAQHAETATLRLYNVKDDMTAAETLEQATTEIQQETPMGAYAVEYITSSSQSQRGYYEIALQISYRRTAEQMQSVVNATSSAALYSLLDSALESGGQELAVRIGYWNQDSAQQVYLAMDQLRQERGIEDDAPWTVYCYPSAQSVGLLEFLLYDEEIVSPDADRLERPAAEEEPTLTEEENGEEEAPLP